MPLLVQVTGHNRLLERNTPLKRLIEMRNPYIESINILQVCAASSRLLWLSLRAGGLTQHNQGQGWQVK